ncbi:hypothetical protein, partial [Staphylococcus aureus]
ESGLDSEDTVDLLQIIKRRSKDGNFK